jgi:D-alanine-D-alanine ligase-like ATP-grasp enzyme
MRVLFLEDDGLLKTVPYLTELGHEAVVLKTGAYDAWHADEAKASGARTVHLPKQASALDLIEAADALDADALVSLALLDPECYRDALVGDYFRQVRRKTAVASPPAAVLLATDKLATKRLLAAHGLPVSEAFWVRSPAEAAEIAERLTYPVLVKRNDGYSGQGMRLFEDHAQLERFFRRGPGPLIMEKFLEGLEVSVDVLCWGGNTVPLAAISKGSTDRDLRRHPIYRLRVAPHPLSPQLTQAVMSIAARAMQLLGVTGVAECELVLTRDEGPLVLEVNPRIAGTLPLSAAASGIDPHRALVDMALGRADLAALEPDWHFAVQAPITTPLTPELMARLSALPQVRFIKPIHWMPSLGITGSLTLRERSPEDLVTFVERVGEFLRFAFPLDALAASMGREAVASVA